MSDVKIIYSKSYLYNGHIYTENTFKDGCKYYDYLPTDKLIIPKSISESVYRVAEKFGELISEGKRND